MKRRILIFLALIALTSNLSALTPQAVEDNARKYRDYDELIDSTSIIEYKNDQYYYIAYTKSLMYSGFMLLDMDGNVVSDDETIKYFAVADILYRNYPKNSTRDWANFQSYFSSSASLDEEGVMSINSDSERIAGHLGNSTYYLGRSLESFSPNDAEKYVESDRAALAAMDGLYDRIKGLQSNEYNDQYRENFLGIKRFVEENLAALMSGADHYKENMKLKVRSKEDKTTEIMLWAAFGLVIALSVFLKIRSTKR